MSHGQPVGSVNFRYFFASGQIGSSHPSLLFRTAILTGVASMSLAVCHPVLAQDAGRPIPDNSATETGARVSPETTMTQPSDSDIIVTANKRQQRLNSVPSAISAFGVDDRILRGIITPQDLAKFTPGVAISDRPNARVNIRGIGRVTNTLGSDAGVANYSDGFYYANITEIMATSDFFADRVEVLRGPAGTLYGRNSIGGAVNVISKRPTKDLVIEGKAFLNDYLQYGAGLSISGPISDRVRYRFAALGQKQDRGYVRNIAGPDQSTEENYVLQAQLEADVTDDLNIWVKLEHNRFDQRPPAQVLIDPYSSVPYFGGLVANGNFGLQNPSTRDPYKVQSDVGGREKTNASVTAMTHVTLSLSDVTIRYVGGYSQYDYHLYRDFDQTDRSSYTLPLNGTTLTVPTNYVEVVGEKGRWTSSELNVLSTPGGSVDWIVGAYFYHEHITQPYALTVPNAAVFAQPVFLQGVTPFANLQRAYYAQAGDLRSRSLAGFGQITWRFAPHWSIEVGSRYSWDRKAGKEDQQQVYYNVLVDPNAAFGILNQTRSGLRDSWSAVTGNASLTFEPTARTLAYVKYSRGYKSGGFTLGALAAQPEVGAEHVNAYELGLKQKIGPAQINSSLFYNDYEGQQVPVNIQTAPGVISAQLFNVPKSRSYGFETEAFVRPLRPLELSLIYSYLNATFRKFSGVFDPALATPMAQDLRGKTLPQSPRNRLTLNGVLTEGPFDLSVSQSWVSEQYFQIFNTNSYRAPAYSDTSLRLTYTGSNGNFRIIGGVSNIFDNTSYSYVDSLAYSAGALRKVSLRLPRIFSLEVRVKM